MPQEETSNYSQGKAVGNTLTQQPRSGGILVYWSGSPKLVCPAGSSGVNSRLRGQTQLGREHRTVGSPCAQSVRARFPLYHPQPG